MAKITIALDPKSWDKAKGKEIKGTKLTAALKAVEKALAEEKKKGDQASIDASREAVQAAASAASEVSKKECDAKKHKDLVAALKAFDSTCKNEIKRLEDAKKKAADDNDEDGDESDEELFGIKLFKECIKKAKLKSNIDDGVSFCLAIHKDPLENKFVMRKKKKQGKQTFKRVWDIAKKDKSLGLKRPKMTYGSVYRDPQSKETLVLHIVDGAPTDIPGMVRKLEKWRKKFKQDILPFKELSIRYPSGKPIEATPDPDDPDDSAFVADGAAASEAQAATESAPADGDTATEAAQAENQAAPEAATAANQPAAEATDEAALEDRRKEFRQARRVWQTVKEKAIQDLEAVKDGIRDYYLDDPEQFKIATSKLNQLDAIMDNLNDDLRDVLDKRVSTPKSRQAEIERLESEATQIVERFLDFAANDRLLNAVDQKEFADVTVKAPIEKALKELVKTFG